MLQLIIHENIDENEKDPSKLAKATTDYIYDVALEKAIRFIREDADLNAMTDKQKRFVLRLMTDRVVERFFEDFEKKWDKKCQK